jgi:hypothetical protein
MKSGCAPFTLLHRMKRSSPMTSLSRLLALSSLSLTLASCGDKTPPPTPAPQATQPETTQAPAAKPDAPKPAPETMLSKAPSSADEIFAAPPPIDLNGFGSDEPVERPDLPSRGVIKLGPKDFIHTTMQHWDQFDWAAFKPSRWGRYAVRMTYTLSRASLPVQLKIGDQRLKKNLTAAGEPAQVYLGEIYLATADAAPFSMFSPTSGPASVMDVKEIAFIPTRESSEPIQLSEDGGVTLHAKSATTWSQTMRYEPKPEKNCLGFWTDPADFAEWEFVSSKPGRYRVTVTQGCGPQNGGSQVEVRLNSQKSTFTVIETNGFQDWKDVDAGILEIVEPGLQRLVIQPLDKKGKAVMDVQKVTLSPAS